jgi:glycosyltransferase involved in cell wall biosynthesis
MRIGIDAYPLSRDKLTGLGSYMTNLLQQLQALDKDNEYFLYAPREISLPFENERWQICQIKGPRPIREISTLWLLGGAKKMLAKDRIDIFVGTQNFIPPVLPAPIKKVLVIHDLCLFVCPQNVPLSLYIPHKMIFNKSLLAADRIVAISESTRSDIKKYFPQIKEDTLKTVYYGGPDPAFSPSDKKEAIRYLSQKFNISDRFILTVTSLEWRKNVTGLLAAFDLCRKKYGIPHKLLIAGGERRAKAKDIDRLYKKLGLENSVHFLGHLSIKELNYLYNTAEALVFPSFYEGFGLPPLEAMACATPVVASDIAVLREILLDAALFADPYDPIDIAEKIYRLLTEEKLRIELIRRGKERLKSFSWENTARQMIKIFDSLKIT